MTCFGNEGTKSRLELTALTHDTFELEPGVNVLKTRIMVLAASAGMRGIASFHQFLSHSSPSSIIRSSVASPLQFYSSNLTPSYFFPTRFDFATSIPFSFYDYMIAQADPLPHCIPLKYCCYSSTSPKATPLGYVFCFLLAVGNGQPTQDSPKLGQSIGNYPTVLIQ